MSWWIYKCNSRQGAHQKAYGDWQEVFGPGIVRRWGSTEWGPSLEKLSPGDKIIAYQTNRNELVGLAEVVKLKKRGIYKDLILKPIDTIGIKVKPLKQKDPKIAAIPALQPGPIMTIYPIDIKDAKRLLSAAGKKDIPEPMINLSVSQFDEKKFSEGEKRAALQTVRNPKLRAAAKIKWGHKCYCCGFDFKNFYGPFAAGSAIVHHLKVFSGDNKSRKSNVDDVRIVCANCHYVMHLNSLPMGLDKLKRIIESKWTHWSKTGIKRRN